MSITLTIFDVSIKEKRVYGSLCFELLPQQMSQSKKKYMDLCQHANKYKQVVFEGLHLPTGDNTSSMQRSAIDFACDTLS